jgi:CAAX protease family protein
MTTIRQMIQRHPLVTYFGLAYGIAWGGILLLVGPKLAQGIPLQLSDGVLMFVPMCLGPSTAGLMMTAIMDGRKGLRDLLSRMGRWRVGIRWYGVALLTTPVLALAVLLTLTALVSPTFAPGFNALGIVFGLVAGFFEEIGWTGFALPKLQSKYHALTAGLLLGVLWGTWHFLANYLGTPYESGARWLVTFLFAPTFVISLTAYRVLITWMYKHTGSVLLAQLMHAFYTGSLFVLSFSLAAGEMMLFYVVFAAVLWVMVAAVVATTGHRLMRAPRQVLAPASR